jgi:hypothetical protein
MKEKNEYVIVSPHCDDEIIGLYELLVKKINPIIIYTCDMSEERKKEALTLNKYVPVKGQLFNKEVPPNLLTPLQTLFFPDPTTEIHPDHRLYGAKGEELARKGVDVIFYSINMNAPYIHKVSDFKDKRHLLEKVYPSQKNLWKFENKYFLFEGRCKWIF